MSGIGGAPKAVTFLINSWTRLQTFAAGLTVPAGQTMTVGGTLDLTGTFTQKASQAQLEAETADTYPDAANFRHHPSTVKAWALFNGTGTVALSGNYNISGLVDNGTGNYTVTFDEDFSSASQRCVTASCGRNNSGSGGYFAAVDDTAAVAAGSCQVLTLNAAGTLLDTPVISIQACGDF